METIEKLTYAAFTATAAGGAFLGFEVGDMVAETSNFSQGLEVLVKGVSTASGGVAGAILGGPPAGRYLFDLYDKYFYRGRE